MPLGLGSLALRPVGFSQLGWLRRLFAVRASSAYIEGDPRAALMPTDTPTKTKTAKLGAEKLTPEEQKRRFIEAAQEAGASENEADFDAALKQIANPKQPNSGQG
ncbi:hypothetical protein [Methylorubrum sp. GM97]|uniref:hypothetical protein n=1 Tax=Methylorubrum sp. GM97 TaxID=2938232 RepID=UPI0021C2AB2B|nr:hypothetical protein [Methylorubrum sp. GM97]